MTKIYFVSGVSGVGKTSTITHLKEQLPADSFDIHDFDERGVPDGGGSEWHASETKYFLDLALKNSERGLSTVVCGFNEPERVRAVTTAEHLEATLILLHAPGEVIEKRLLGRYPTKESEKEIARRAGKPLADFARECVSFAPVLREKFAKEQCRIIETEHLTPAEVAHEISTILLTPNP